MKWLIVFILILPLGVNAQKKIKLKRKYIAKYEGVVPAYSMGSALEIVDVDETLTTAAANAEFDGSQYSLKRKTELRDQFAACLILESYLSTYKK